MIDTPADSVLFPAYAGVILATAPAGWIWGPFPRLRGGDPPGLIGAVVYLIFSPPMRG